MKKESLPDITLVGEVNDRNKLTVGVLQPQLLL